MTNAQLLVGAPSDEELRRIVVEPARRTGVAVEPALVDLVAHDVGGYDAVLPLVSVAMAEVWERRDGGVLRAGATSRWAASAPRWSVLAHRRSRTVNPRSTSPSGAAQPGRRHRRRRLDPATCPVDELPPRRPTPLDALVDARLVVRNEETVEIVHEVVFRAWPLLAGWLEEARADLVLERDLRIAARVWDDDGRTDDNLYRGARLHAALEWAERSPEVASPFVDDFLAAGRQHAERHEHEIREQLDRERRTRRRLTWAFGAAALLLVVAIVAGATALTSRNEAERERRVATARELAGASAGALADDPERSTLLALAAIEMTRGADGSALPEAVEALHAAVTGNRLVRSIPGLGGALDWSVNGLFATEGPEETGIIDIRDAETGESVVAFHGHDIDVTDVVFSADGSMLATAGDDGDLRVWETASGAELTSFEFDVGGYGVNGASFSRDGARVAASWLNEGLIRVFDLGSGEMISEIESEWANGTEFSADGSQLFFANANRPQLSVADVESGDVVRMIETHGAWMRDIALSPNGQWIATTGDIAEVWDAVSGERVFAVPVHSHVDDVAWSPDGGRLATGSFDGAARVYEVVEANLVETLELSNINTENGVYSIAFSPDGAGLMGGDTNVTAVSIWDVSPTGGGEWANFAGAPVGGAAMFDEGGNTVIASTGGGQAGAWDIARGEMIGTIGLAHARTANRSAIAVSGDARVVAMAINDAMPVDVWDVRTNERLFSVSEPDQTNVWDMDWTPDGEFLALGGADQSGGFTIVVDHAGREVARIPEEPDVIVNGVALSPDGRFVAWSRKPARDDPRVPGSQDLGHDRRCPRGRTQGERSSRVRSQRQVDRHRRTERSRRPHLGCTHSTRGRVADKRRVLQ